MIKHTTFWNQLDHLKVMVAKQLSINSILASIYEIYLVMPAPPQFPDVGIGQYQVQNTIASSANPELTPRTPEARFSIGFTSAPCGNPEHLAKSPGLCAPLITFINAAAFSTVCRQEGSVQFSIQLRQEPDGKLRAASVEDAPDLSAIPKEYHDFADVFSKSNTSVLPPHREFDLKIELEEGATPPPGRLYSLSPFELNTLREFIDENLSTGFICLTSSSLAAPVLFIKKDGSLQLCVDY